MAKTPETVDLMFLARQIERLINDVANIRDEMDVQTAIILRLDANQGAVLTELRSIHKQINRMNSRIEKLEEAQT